MPCPLRRTLALSLSIGGKSELLDFNSVPALVRDPARVLAAWPLTCIERIVEALSARWKRKLKTGNMTCAIQTAAVSNNTPGTGLTFAGTASTSSHTGTFADAYAAAKSTQGSPGKTPSIANGNPPVNSALKSMAKKNSTAAQPSPTSATMPAPPASPPLSLSLSLSSPSHVAAALQTQPATSTPPANPTQSFGNSLANLNLGNSSLANVTLDNNSLANISLANKGIVAPTPSQPSTRNGSVSATPSPQLANAPLTPIPLAPAIPLLSLSVATANAALDNTGGILPVGSAADNPPFLQGTEGLQQPGSQTAPVVGPSSTAPATPPVAAPATVPVSAVASPSAPPADLVNAASPLAGEPPAPPNTIVSDRPQNAGPDPHAIQNSLTASPATASPAINPAALPSITTPVPIPAAQNRHIDSRPAASQSATPTALPMIDKSNPDGLHSLQVVTQTAIATAISADGFQPASRSAWSSSSSSAIPTTLVASSTTPAGQGPASAELNAAGASLSSEGAGASATSSKSAGPAALHAGTSAAGGTAVSQTQTTVSQTQPADSAGLITVAPQAAPPNNSALLSSASAVQVAIGTSANSAPPHSALPHKSDAAADLGPAPSSTSEPPAPLPPGPVQMAQLVAKAGQSEMHIGLNTSAFGSVEVHTIVHANEVGVSIGSEKGDLRSMLANELPGIVNTLQQQHNLRLDHVNFQQGYTPSNHQGRDAQQRWFTRPAAPTADSRGIDGGNERTEPGANSSPGLGTGLSILA